CFLHVAGGCSGGPRFTEETDMDCQATSFVSVTQCDPTSGIDPVCWPATVTDDVSCAAKRLAPQERQDLVIQVLAGTETVSELARQHEVSRKFLYQQVHTAEEALSEAFTPSSRPDDVLFYLPVTKAWLRQLVLALVLICHSSYRGVVELLRDLFDYRISLGTVHNIVHSAVPHSQRINQQHDLSRILIGLLDEIFQARDPVLVGVDAASTFCFLLSRKSIATPIPGASGCWNWSTEASLPRPPSPISARGSGPGTRRLCLRFPAAVMFFMRCTTSGRWSVTWRTGPTKPSTPGPSWSESKPLPSGGMAGRTRVWSRSYRPHDRLRPRRSRWLMRWRCEPVGYGTTSCRWPVRSTPSAVICWTSWWRSCAPASRPVRSGSGRYGPCWRTSGTIFWPSLWNWTLNWRPWPK